MIMEITLIGQFAGQLIVNRWNYLAAGSPAAVTHSFALASAFGFVEDQIPPNTATPFGAIINLVAVAATFTEAIVRAVYDVEDFYTTPFIPVVPGNNGEGDTASPTVALGFRTNRVRQDIRRGTKRFAGVPESAVGVAGTLTSGMITAMNVAATQMADVLEYDDEGNTLTYAPIVVSRQKYVTNPEEDDPRYAYRYYPTLAEQLTHIAQGITWTPYTQTRTQVSRQYGHGA